MVSPNAVILAANRHQNGSLLPLGRTVVVVALIIWALVGWKA